MDTPIKILNLIDRRASYAEKMIEADSKIKKWLNENGFNYFELEANYACMMFSEPQIYKELTKKLIESEENK